VTFADANGTLARLNGALETGDRALVAAEAAFSSADRVLGEEVGTLAAQLRERPGVDAVVTADEIGRPFVATSPDVVIDEEVLPFAPDSFTSVLSAMSLHWVNDLPGLLTQLRHCLAGDGLFLAVPGHFG